MTETPNIVIIIADQQRWDTLACNGNVFVESPNIDRLAGRGVSFEKAFTPYPVCTPARASMWTGVYPHAHGAIYNRYGIDDVFAYETKVKTTVFEILQAGGYTTAYVGKWHLGEKNSGRFDFWRGFNSHGGHWVDGKQASQGGTFKPDVQTDELIEFFKSAQAKEKPFVAVQSYYPPHNPFTAPTKFYEHYRNKGVPFAGYYAAVSAIDACTGRVLDALNSEGLTDNTIVIYLSDHGETFNYEETAPHKWVCLDTSIRVPFIMAGPGIPSDGRRISPPVGLVDLAPTILDAAGLTVPSIMQGRSILGLVNGTAKDWPKEYYVQSELRKARTQQRALRTDDWKLILSWDEGHELYDLRVDPEEDLNVFDTPRKDKHNRFQHFADYSDVIVTLATTMRERALAIDDSVGVELSELVLRHKS
jgi:arylsulfatase A-like enzyme